ncbi:internal head protein [Pseudomonas phage Psa21]|uniref:Virion structural protein n=1 Tax=Pseudomonas phage Psa21 TaxID=2530023 RepID=A0A481W4H6_9CAUD|nr:internal head protein [Pseudomonas phage Psa21]QBJ02636.1 virion structural protein [Pseudomonas phage Psa21]
MDFKERLKRLEERRGESSDDWMAKFYQETGGDANESILKIAELLGDSDENMSEEIIDLVGGLEHYQSYESIGDTPFFFTGMEGIGDTVVRIFDRIIAFIKKWIKVLADADFKLSLHAALHTHSLENIRTQMRTTGRKANNRPFFPVYTRVANLSVNYRPITNAPNLVNALTVLRAVADAYFKQHADHVLGQVQQVVIAVAQQKPASFLAEQMKQVSPVNVGTAPIMKLDALQYVSPHLMGGHRFIITNANANSSDPTDNVNGTRVKLEPSQLTPVEAPAAINFEYFDAGMTEAVLSKCDSILTILSESNNGPHRHQRRQALAALLAAVERVNEEIQRNGVRDEESARAVVAVLESYIAWIADPYTSFYAYVLRNVRAALNVCEANIA